MALLRSTRSSHEQLAKVARLSWTRETARLPESLTSDTFNGGVKFLGDAISIDVSEQGRWLDGVSSSAGSSKVVHNRD